MCQMLTSFLGESHWIADNCRRGRGGCQKSRNFCGSHQWKILLRINTLSNISNIAWKCSYQVNLATCSECDNTSSEPSWYQRFVSSTVNIKVLLTFSSTINSRCLAYFGPKKYISKPKLSFFAVLLCSLTFKCRCYN